MWQGVEVTDSADIAALLKNTINQDAMNLYDANDAAINGFLLDARMDSVHVVACVKQGDEGNWYGLGYAKESWPEEVIVSFQDS